MRYGAGEAIPSRGAILQTKLKTRWKTWLAPLSGAMVLLGVVYLHYMQPLLIEAVSLSV